MTIGVDVSKDSLDVAGEGVVRCYPNTPAGIRTLLASLTAPATVAMEATGRYHRLLAETALAHGHRVYVLNPKDVQRYAASVSPRAATDPIAARVIAEFAALRAHRPYQSPPAHAEQLKELVRTRAGLVTARVASRNQVEANPAAGVWLLPAIEGMTASIQLINRQITRLATALPAFARLDGIPGFGTLISAYLLALLLGGPFVSSDAFVAFLGLDTRVKQSGKHVGTRRLTKRGDPEARRLLFLAARAAARQPGPYQDIYRRALARGWSSTAAAIIVARKLARTAWAVYTHQVPYTPARVCTQPTMPVHMPSPVQDVEHVGTSPSTRTPERHRPSKRRQQQQQTAGTIDNTT